MRKIAQFVALAATILFAGQSMQAEAFCAEWLNPGCARTAACCMTASGSPQSHVAMECHGEMGIAATRAELNPSPCNMTSAQAVTQALITADKKAVSASAAVAVVQNLVPTPSAQIVERPAHIAASGRARYLLFQVFRI